MVKVTGVVFKNGGKLYYFAPGKEKYEKDMGVIVDTARGHEYAIVKRPLLEVPEEQIIPPLKPIIRIATARDKEAVKKSEERKPESMRITQELIEKHKLNMKLVDCEFAFDGTKVVFYYTAPSRVDFRELVKEMSSVFKMRIELRQIGIRDEIKMIGGLGACGRECCCSTCMPDLKKVTIKMAKTQGLSLNPSKISGMCGRLMCCLSYENDYYAEAGKVVPKIGESVSTPEGKGTVVNINMLKMQVRVKIEDKKKDIVTYHDYPVEQIKFKHTKPEDKDDDLSEDLKEILD
ncbi:MAG: stage 0 sporulation family protein [Clostridia bacterium]|nr:stage 0 sporulation family protein [Clostridia bacterium]